MYSISPSQDVDSEAIMVVAQGSSRPISNGSACTSQTYSPSHVLLAMQLPEEAVAGAIRLSWCHYDARCRLD